MGEESGSGRMGEARSTAIFIFQSDSMAGAGKGNESRASDRAEALSQLPRVVHSEMAAVPSSAERPRKLESKV